VCDAVGGGWQKKPTDLSSAAIVGITVLVFAVILCLTMAIYCFVRRPRIFRRRYNGGRASDYVSQSDASAQMPSPPPYDVCAMPCPPPYSATDSTDKPPDYEVVLLRNGQCLYQRQTQHDASDSDAADDQQMRDHSTA